MDAKSSTEEDRKEEKSSLLKIKKRREFKAFFGSSKRSYGSFITVDFLKTDKPARLGITAPTKYGSAVERNRFKRISREAFRRLIPLFDGYDINIFPKSKAKDASMQDIFTELKHHLDEIKSAPKRSSQNCKR